MELSETFQKRIAGAFGKEGRQWIDRIPDILRDAASKWSLEIEPSSYDLSYNYVTNARMSDGRRTILKVGYTGQSEWKTERMALELFGGRSVVELLAYDDSLGVMILERLEPGYTLRVIERDDDVRATSIAAELIRTVPVQIQGSHSFPSVRQWSDVLDEPVDGIDQSIVADAKNIFDELDSSKDGEFLIHGDLHHENILFSDERGWVAIDPKGVTGDIAYNAARFLNNPRDAVASESALPKRIEILSSVLEQDPKRIAGYGYVDSIISACWTLEEGGTPSTDLEYAKLLRQLL